MNITFEQNLIQDRVERDIYVKHLKGRFKEFFQLIYPSQLSQLHWIRSNYDSFIVSQSPALNCINETMYSDFSLFDKQTNLDMRIEIKTLRKKSTLSSSISTIRNYTEIPEKEMGIVLIGDGYKKSADLVTFKNDIQQMRYPIHLFFSIAEFGGFIETLFS